MGHNCEIVGGSLAVWVGKLMNSLIGGPPWWQIFNHLGHPGHILSSAWLLRAIRKGKSVQGPNVTQELSRYFPISPPGCVPGPLNRLLGHQQPQNEFTAEMMKLSWGCWVSWHRSSNRLMITWLGLQKPAGSDTKCSKNLGGSDEFWRSSVLGWHTDMIDIPFWMEELGRTWNLAPLLPSSCWWWLEASGSCFVLINGCRASQGHQRPWHTSE